MTTLGPGVHDIPPDTYHRDPCEEPSLSSSGIKRLLIGSPAEFAASHPRLTDWKEELENALISKAMENGSIAHSIVLGKGARYVEAHPNDFRNKDGTVAQTWGSGEAKKFKAEQKALGNIILNRGSKRSSGIEAACAALRDFLATEYGDFPLGESEQTIIWQKETTHGLIWCRAMLDHVSRQHMLILDPKFTDLGLDDRSLQKKAAAEMWHIQQRFYTDAVEAIAPELVGKVMFRFAVQRLKPPYDQCFFDIDDQQPQWLEIARDDIDWSADRFAHCLRTNNWFSRSRSCSMPPPDWLINESARRHDRSPETGEVLF